MPNIFSYLNYHKFLREAFAEICTTDPTFTYRAFASQLQMDASNLHKIIHLGHHPSARTIDKLAGWFKFNKIQKQYFSNLVAFAKSKTERHRQKIFESLLPRFQNEAKISEADKFLYYQKWYHNAIFTLLYFYLFKGDFLDLATRLQPRITKKQARESIELLLRLKYIEIDTNGRYIHTGRGPTPGNNWKSLALNNFQSETVKLALNAIANLDSDQQDNTALSVTLSESGLDKIKKATSDYRKAIVRAVSEDKKADRIYQINIQIFPMSQVG